MVPRPFMKMCADESALNLGCCRSSEAASCDVKCPCLAGAVRAEAFPSLGQMSDGPKRAPSMRGPAAAPSLPDTQKGSQPGSAPKMGFANAVSGERCLQEPQSIVLVCGSAAISGG